MKSNSEAPRGALRWVARILSFALIVLLAAIAYTLTREHMARRTFRAKYPPPGRMVNFDGGRLHLNCVGAGKPVVLFEADADQLGSLTWSLVQNKVGQFTRACSYDRAGFMWSSPGPRPRDGKQISMELAALLNAAGEQGPYVMVGHALGGAYARIFSGQNPTAVCGMVLVDSAHPDQFARAAAIGIEQRIPERQIRPLILFLSHLGQPPRNRGPQYSMPREVYDAAQAFLPESSMAWFDERVEGRNTLAQSGKYERLGKLPLIVLASARAASRPNGVAGSGPQEMWTKLQRQLTLLSENSEIKTLAESGHYIQFDQPLAVVDAVRGVVNRCATTQERR